MKQFLDRRPILVALAGPNGAGKTTFYHAYLEPSGLRLLNPDVMAEELRLDPEDTTRVATAVRLALVRQRESFVFETVLSDPVGDKVEFLKDASRLGYAVVLCFIGLASVATCETRVAMRVSQGGHDVPTDKLIARYPRALANLRKAIRALPAVFIFDNEDIRTPFRKVAVFEYGKARFLSKPPPKWLLSLLPEHHG